MTFSDCGSAVSPQTQVWRSPIANACLFLFDRPVGSTSIRRSPSLIPEKFGWPRERDPLFFPACTNHVDQLGGNIGNKFHSWFAFNSEHHVHSPLITCINHYTTGTYVWTGSRMVKARARCLDRSPSCFGIYPPKCLEFHPAVWLNLTKNVWIGTQPR